jgi:PAS domain S-box-containing protein
MKQGMGVTLHINVHTERTIRLAGLAVPIILVLYGWLLRSDIIETNRVVNVPLLYAISALWIGLGLYNWLIPARTRVNAAARLFVYHALAVAYVLFISGLAMPFTACAVVLFLASYTYFGRDGLNLSILVLFVTMLGDMMMHMDDTQYMIQSGLFSLGSLVVGFVCGTVVASQEVDRLELARNQAEKILQRDRILTIVNNLADAVISTDKDGVIRVYNAACLNLLDTNRDLNGLHIDKILRLTDDDNKTFKLLPNFALARGVVTREDLRATISGETIRLSLIYSPIRGNDSSSNQETHNDGFVIILRDITKQKSLEEERDEFISVVSHELRTPITVAEGSLSNLEFMMSRTEVPKQTLEENIKLSHEQVLFLARMVNDLSTLSRAERGVADAAEEISMDELVQDLYKEYAPQAEAKGLRFNLDTDAQLGNISASRLYLKELLQNFITNAIKYTKEGEVTLIAKKLEGHKLQLAVKDTGIGISKSDQAHIFEKFWRSEDYRTRETGGTGLGLYVVRKLAKKLGIDIEMSSRLNHGSTFKFTIATSKKTR